MRQAMRIRNGWSLENSQRMTPVQHNRKSENKLQRIKEVLRPVQIMQMIQKLNNPKNSYLSPIKGSAKPAHKSHIQTISFNNLTQQKQSPKQQMPISIERSIKMRKGIRIRTEQQIRNSPKTSKIKGLVTLQNSVQLKKDQKWQKLSEFEKQEAKMYEVLYVGERRIHCDQDFTNIDGDPVISMGDSIKFRYQILSQLGHGAFGYVFKAYDHKRRETVALKIIKNHVRYQKQAKVQIRILQQAILNDDQNNSNIVQLKSAFLFRGHPCLIFQLLYINLYQFCFQMNFTGLSLDLIRRFCIQILQSLHFLQKHKIVHCDIKPQNIMIRRENKTGLKLIDFGSGCYEGEQIYNYVQSRFYRSPQIVLGVKYGCEIDMWSFGCVAFQLYAGRPLFSGQDQQDQISLFIQALGLPPIDLIELGNRSDKYFIIKNGQIKTKFQSSRAKARLPNTKSIQKQLKRCSDDQYIDFVKKCLSWSPKSRMKASEALLHPWIMAGIPEQLRLEHKRNLK